MTRWSNVVRSREIRSEGQVILRREFGSGVVYTNEAGWMTRKIFQQELIRFSKFLKKTKPNKKCLLLLDNFSGHRKINLPALGIDNLQLEYFRPNTTGAYQPCDQDGCAF
jgi:hypothetical protein